MIDILIATYNSSRTIVECLKSIPRLVNGIPPQVYVCDDASSDKTLDLCTSITWPFPLTIIANKSNRGVGVTRQILLKSSSNPYLLFLDSDDSLSSCSEPIHLSAPIADITLLSRHIKCRELSQSLFESSINPYQSPRSGTIETLLQCLHSSGAKFSECWGIIFKRSIIDQSSLAL